MERQGFAICLHDEMLRNELRLVVCPSVRMRRSPIGGMHDLKRWNLGDVEDIVDAKPIAARVNPREMIDREVSERMCCGITD
jgi:hypothetical protein